MRLYLMELKRILKTRSVLIVILGAIVLTALLAYGPSYGAISGMRRTV